MFQHLLRVAAAIATLVGGGLSCSATAAPHPSIRVQVVEAEHDLKSSAHGQEPSTTTPSNSTYIETAAEQKKDQVPIQAVAVLPETVSKEDQSVQESEEPSDESQAAEVATSFVAPIEAAPIIDTPPQVVWQVHIQDGTVRQALSRWAMTAGWIDHWELSVDIPITADAALATTTDFPQAVQRLAEAVSLSEVPIRPCFYSNNVVRIVPYNTMCNRTMARPERD